MKYVKTDGRPWYKQVISGVYLTLWLLWCTVAALFVVLIVVATYQNVMTSGISIVDGLMGTLKIIGGLVVVVLFAMFGCWSLDGGED